MKYYIDKNKHIFKYNDNIDTQILEYRIDKLGLTSITEKELENLKAQQDLDNKVAEKQEISSLHSYLNNTNYIAINYGALRTDDKKALFLATTSDTYNLTNEEILDKRDLAIDRINELKAQLESL